jgi:hypothetical protein
VISATQPTRRRRPAGCPLAAGLSLLLVAVAYLWLAQPAAALPAVQLSSSSWKLQALPSLETQERPYSVSKTRIRGLQFLTPNLHPDDLQLKKELLRAFTHLYGGSASGRPVVGNNAIRYSDPSGLVRDAGEEPWANVTYDTSDPYVVGHTTRTVALLAGGIGASTVAPLSFGLAAVAYGGYRTLNSGSDAAGLTASALVLLRQLPQLQVPVALGGLGAALYGGSPADAFFGAGGLTQLARQAQARCRPRLGPGDDFSAYTGGGGGVYASLGKDGFLELVIQTASGTPRGSQMFNEALAAFGSNVKGIRASLTGGGELADSFKSFQAAVAAGQSPEQVALASTFTGKVSSRAGFGNVRITKNADNHVVVEFTK